MDNSEELSPNATDITHYRLAPGSAGLAADGSLERVEATPQTRKQRSRFSRMLNANSAFYRWQKRTIRDVKKWLSARNDRMVPRYYYHFVKPLPPEFERAWLLTETLVREAKALADNNGFVLMVANMPTLEMLEPDQVRRPLLAGSEYTDGAVYVHHSHDKLSRVCAEQGIEYKYLYDAYLQHFEKKPFLYDDGHFTETGHQILAEELYSLVGAVREPPQHL